MAISHLVPETAVIPGDLVTLKEVRDILGETPYPYSITAIRRWIVEGGIRTVRIERTVHVSMTDMFLAHRDAVNSNKRR